MSFHRQKLYLQIVFLLTATCVSAQESWPIPEIEQMYHHAQDYVTRGDLNGAETTYRQAILLAPGKIVLYKELGNTLCLLGKYSEAEQTLSVVCSKPGADAACFQLLAASQAAQNEQKKAIATLQKGLARFPISGLLYHERGKVFLQADKQEPALNAWLDGIVKEPGYAPNYYEAAITYLSTNKVMWGLLYGEMFLDMQHDTAGEENIKNKLFAGYKKLFDGFATDETPQYGKAKTAKPAKSFEDAVMQVYSRLTPVVSDGISTENLTMVRTRFLMDWFTTYGNKYPFSLFSYQDSMVKYGKSDIWNEWIFGKAENELQYQAWDTFHKGDISRTKDWQYAHLLHATARDSYNDRDMDELFEKKRK